MTFFHSQRMVDYMPIQLAEDVFVQFVYKPDYLQNQKYIATQTDTAPVCGAIDIYPRQCDIILDGGNIIKGGNWVILTEKVFKENKHIEKSILLNQIEKLFSSQVIVIPVEPYDFTGHADGIIRYYDSNTVLMNRYQDKQHKSFRNRLRAALKTAGISAIEIEYKTAQQRQLHGCQRVLHQFFTNERFYSSPYFSFKGGRKSIKTIEDLFPDHAIDTIDSRDISKDGGVLNCISWNIKR